LGHHERAEHCQNDDHDHDLDEGKAALPIAHDDLENSVNDTKLGDPDAS